MALSKAVVHIFQNWGHWLQDTLHSHLENVWRTNAGALQAFGETADKARREICRRVSPRNVEFVRRLLDTQHFSVWLDSFVREKRSRLRATTM